MLNYEKLSDEVSARIKNNRKNGFVGNLAFNEEDVIRRDNNKDKTNIIRTAFIRDIDKILHCPYYNRYADKTQDFSFYKNDDITRRGLHVQLVSRIAFETVWEKKATEETMTEEFYKVIKAQQKVRKTDPTIKWRVIRVFDELGHQICQES